MTRLLYVLMAFLAGIAAAHLQMGEPRAALAVGSLPGNVFRDEAKPISASEATKVEAYLRQLFANPKIRLVLEPPEAGAYIDKKFVGVLYPEEDHGERFFYFEMEILESDLEEGSARRSRR